jgi:hypothetical protein
VAIFQLLTMGSETSATELQLINQFAIPRSVDRSQIVQKPTAAADKLQKTLARTVVLAVQLEVGRELIDSFRDQGDLNGRPPGVGGMLFKPLNGGFLYFLS